MFYRFKFNLIINLGSETQIMFRQGETTKAIREYAEEASTQYQHNFGGVAQLGEHLPCKQGVRSSILLISTKRFSAKQKNRECARSASRSMSFLKENAAGMQKAKSTPARAE